VEERCDICGEKIKREAIYILKGNIYYASYDEMDKIAVLCPKCFWLKFTPARKNKEGEAR